MTSPLIFRGRLEAEAKQYVAEVKTAVAANEQLKASETAAAKAAGELATETDKVTRSTRQSSSETKADAEAKRQATEAARKLAAEQKQVADAARRAENAIRQQSLALRYTASDVVASLASGSNPMTILMQQGPQLLQQFNSPREAIQGIISQIGPMRAAFAGVAAGIGLMVAAGESYAASLRQIDVALETHGNRIAMSRAQYRAMASEISDVASVSERAGRTIAASLIENGARSGEAMLGAAQAARGFGIAIGKDASEAATDLAAMLRNPAKAARELGEQFNWLDGATIRNIETMQRQGDMMGAQQQLMSAVSANVAGLENNVSGLARAWEWAGIQASNTWDLMGRISAAGSPLDPGWALRFMSQGLPKPEDPSKRFDPLFAQWRENSRFVADASDRYNPLQAELRRVNDDIAKMGMIGATNAVHPGSAKPEDRQNAEEALAGMLRRRKDLLEQIAKIDAPEIDKATAKLEVRAGREREELALLERIVAARAAGDSAGARSAQGQLDALKQGFDLASGMGREMAGIAERSRALQAALRSMDDLDAQLGRLNPNVTPQANARRLQAEIRAAEEWRDRQVGALNLVRDANGVYAADIELVFNDRIASAYDADLRRRTDWASGVQRGLRDLQRQAADFASTSERGLRQTASAWEESFVNAARTGRMSFEDLGDAFGEMVIRMAYQKLLAPQINAGLGAAVDLLGSIFGISSVTGGASGSLSGGVGAGLLGHVGHTGMIAGVSGGAHRLLPASVWTGAPRYHNGGFAGDEVPAVLKKGEPVFTPHQMENAESLIRAVAGRPIMIQLPPGMFGRGDGGLRVTINNNVPQARVQQRQDDDGGLTIDILADQLEQRMAGNVGRGRSPLNDAVEQRYGLGKAV